MKKIDRIQGECRRQGLTQEEVRCRREAYGANLLTPPRRPSMWRLYLEKFDDPVVQILLVAALLSLVISVVENEYAETIGIIVAILLATGIGFLFEYDANRKFDLLNAVGEETPVKVVRDGRVQEVPRRDIVVDDIVLLGIFRKFRRIRPRRQGPQDSPHFRRRRIRE